MTRLLLPILFASLVSPPGGARPRPISAPNQTSTSNVFAGEALMALMRNFPRSVRQLNKRPTVIASASVWTQRPVGIQVDRMTLLTEARTRAPEPPLDHRRLVALLYQTSPVSKGEIFQRAFPDLGEELRWIRILMIAKTPTPLLREIKRYYASKYAASDALPEELETLAGIEVHVVPGGLTDPASQLPVGAVSVIADGILKIYLSAPEGRDPDPVALYHEVYERIILAINPTISDAQRALGVPHDLATLAEQVFFRGRLLPREWAQISAQAGLPLGHPAGLLHMLNRWHAVEQKMTDAFWTASQGYDQLNNDRFALAYAHATVFKQALRYSLNAARKGRLTTSRSTVSRAMAFATALTWLAPEQHGEVRRGLLALLTLNPTFFETENPPNLGPADLQAAVGFRNPLRTLAHAHYFAAHAPEPVARRLRNALNQEKNPIKALLGALLACASPNMRQERAALIKDALEFIVRELSNEVPLASQIAGAPRVPYEKALQILQSVRPSLASARRETRSAAGSQPEGMIPVFKTFLNEGKGVFEDEPVGQVLRDLAGDRPLIHAVDATDLQAPRAVGGLLFVMDLPERPELHVKGADAVERIASQETYDHFYEPILDGVAEPDFQGEEAAHALLNRTLDTFVGWHKDRAYTATGLVEPPTQAQLNALREESARWIAPLLDLLVQRATGLLDPASFFAEFNVAIKEVIAAHHAYLKRVVAHDPTLPPGALIAQIVNFSPLAAHAIRRAS
jgi:hypothetical protein